MTNSSETHPVENRPNMLRGIVARAAQIVVALIIEGLILFLISGHLDWIWAWAFLGIYLVSISINSVFLIRTSPETIVERGQPKEVKSWDKLIGGLLGLMQFIVLPLMASLDMRFDWTRELSAPWHLGGAAAFVGGLALSGWAMIANAFFSTAVRIQTDRGHTVCRTGPYRFVRHPGYLGMIIQSIAIPILLGSVWALIPGAVAVALVVIRTIFEDRMLQDELAGYRDYSLEVRYRLVPGFW
jgi:protein-S-isoprenylcysteine O-methyltransferase Ste14